MLSDSQLDEIIQITRDAMFLNHWLVAESQRTRQKLERTRERVYIAIEQSSVDAGRRKAARSGEPERAHVHRMLVVPPQRDPTFSM